MTPIATPWTGGVHNRMVCWGRTALAAAAIGLIGISGAQAAPPDQTPRDLTQAFITVSSAFQKARPSDRAQALANLVEHAQRRHRVLASLIEEDPKEFLHVAVPEELRASLPDVVQPFVEQEVEVEGTLEVYHEDYEAASRFVYKLQTPGERLGLHFANDPPELLTGSRVRVKGMRLNHMLALDSGTTSVTTLALTTPLVSGAQKTLVLMVNFSDKAATFTLDTLRTRVFTTASDYDKENSYGQAWLTGDAFGPLTIALSSTVCDSSTVASQAKSAATNAGVQLSNYNRYLYVFPKNACGWWGLGTIGGNPSQAWINDNPQLRVIAHEMGHNFGLYHSHSLDCGVAVISSSCTASDYGDTVDVMGTSTGHFNAFQKERLGWLNSSVTPPITTAQGSGQYLIDAYEPTGGSSKALKILKSTDSTTGRKTWYYVEFRQPIGADSWMSGNANLTNGVVVHTGSESTANSSYLLDMTPATTSWADPALTVGQTFQDATTGVTITSSSIDTVNKKAMVAVNVSAPACVPGVPQVAITPSIGVVVPPGGVASYTLTMANTDSSNCSAGNFSVTINTQSGWTTSAIPVALTLSPGTSGSSSLQLASPTSLPDGMYNVPVTVTNPASNKGASGNAKYVIGIACSRANPTVVLSPGNGPTVTAGATVTYTASITNNNSAGCGGGSFAVQGTVPPSFTGAVSPTALTLSSGQTATVGFSVTAPRKKFAPGSYSVSVAATNSGYPTYMGTDTSTFNLAAHR